MWLSRTEYTRMAQQLESALALVESAQTDLRIERAENRLAERHWANMFLRRMQTFPLVEKVAPTTTTESAPAAYSTAPPAIDPGELEAMVEAGAAMGVSEAEVKRLLEQERSTES